VYRSYRRERENDIKRAISGWIFRTAKAIQKEARANAPKGVSGYLRLSTKAYYEYPVSIVSVGEPYAKFVEGWPKPTKRHFHSWEHDYAFRQWARRRGFDTSRDKGGLLTWGYANRFFTKAIATVRPKAQADLSRVKL